MNSEIIKRTPRIPHWRWVLWNGPDHPDWSVEMDYFSQYLKEESVGSGVKGTKISSLDSPSEELSRAIRIFLHEPPIRRTVEQMLYERCGTEMIAEVVYHKFKENVGKEVIKQYKTYFYDVDTMNAYDVARFYEQKGQSIPTPPPVPGHMKESYLAFKNGLETNMTPKQIMNHMLQSAFFRAQELSQYGWQGDDRVIKFQKMALSVIQTMNDGELKESIPEEFNYEIEYPSQTAVAADGLDGYDPNDDPNEEPE